MSGERPDSKWHRLVCVFSPPTPPWPIIQMSLASTPQSSPTFSKVEQLTDGFSSVVLGLSPRSERRLRTPLGKETGNFITPEVPSSSSASCLPRMRPLGCLWAGRQVSISLMASGHQSRDCLKSGGQPWPFRVSLCPEEGGERTGTRAGFLRPLTLTSWPRVVLHLLSLGCFLQG